MNRFLFPTLLVASMWIAVSLSTTAFVVWLEASHQYDFERDVRCTEAAGSLMEHIWHLQADIAVHEDASKTEDVKGDSVLRQLQADVAVLLATPGSNEHEQLTRAMSRASAEYAEVWDRRNRDSVLPSDQFLRQRLADQLADLANRLRELHHEQLRKSAASRRVVSKTFFWIRATALMVGPLLGWWMARRLGRVMNEIRVRLETHVGLPSDRLGVIQFRAEDDLSLIQQQVELITQRLRATAEDLEQANQEVLRSDRLAAVGRLAAGVAHEIRNPLTSVKLLIQYADQPGSDGLNEQQRLLILDEIDRMEHTIQGLLDLSRTIPIQKTRHDVRETLTRASQLISGRAGRQQTEVQLDLGSTPLWIDGDVPQLHQVFVNLFLNALESVSQGGVLRVKSAELSDPRRIMIEIQDSGMGIRDDLLPRLFEPFVTSKDHGTGLGLAISKRIIESHGGTIQAANSNPGAVFHIELPASSHGD